MCRRLVAALAFLALSATLGFGAEQPDRPGLRVFRFWRSGGQTLVSGVVSIPMGPMARALSSDTTVHYELSVQVRDGSDAVLVSDSWANDLPWEVASPAGSVVEFFNFAVGPGVYSIEVNVRSGRGGVPETLKERVDVVGAPLSSDLLLSSAIRFGEDPAPGEIKKGSFLIRVSETPTVSALDPQLFYYIEIYPSGAVAEEDTLEAATGTAVYDASGREFLRTREKPITLSPSGAIDVGRVRLAGLPPGSYVFAVETTVGDRRETRQGSFRMLSPAEAKALEARALLEVPPPTALDRHLAGLTDATMDSLYGAVALYFLEGGPRATYRALPPDGRRNLLNRFFADRDPNGPAAGNPFHEEYLARVRFANRELAAPGQTGAPGWKTDRGRIHIKYGPPDEQLSGQVPSGQQFDYVVWKYTKDRDLRFVFLDRTGFGNFDLIFTTDRTEVGYPNWEGLLGPDALERVVNF